MKPFHKKIISVAIIMLDADLGICGLPAVTNADWGRGICADPSECDGRNARISVIPAIQPRRAVVRGKLLDDTSLICGQNALCGTLNGTFDYIYGQVGIYFYHVDLNQNLFVPIYAMQAVKSSDNQYKIPKWDGKIFWMIVNPNAPPRPLQPQFIDEDQTGEKQLVSKVAYYRQNGNDYSAYPDNAALCNIHITADKNNQVTDYYMDVYDQDLNFSETGRKLDIGDSIALFHSGTDDSAWDTALGLENIITVTQEPAFVYAGYIPGRDIGCTYCVNQIALVDTQSLTDLAGTDLYFRLEGMNFNTEYVPIWSEKQPLGKLSDNAYANGTCGTANGTNVTTAPTTNLCSTGTASTVTGTGPWNWSCTGTNGGTTASCSANIIRYTVTPSAGVGGMVSPNTVQTVNYGVAKSFTVTANTGYTRNNVVGGTCLQGSWSNNVWTTGPTTANCTVGFSFHLCGDADGNGKVNIVDALSIARKVVGLPPPPPINIVAADVDQDGLVTIVDALNIAKHAVGLVVTDTCF